MINMAHAYQRPLADEIDSAYVCLAGKGMDEVVMVTLISAFVSFCVFEVHSRFNSKLTQMALVYLSLLPSGQVFHELLDFKTFSPSKYFICELSYGVSKLLCDPLLSRLWVSRQKACSSTKYIQFDH